MYKISDVFYKLCDRCYTISLEMPEYIPKQQKYNYIKAKINEKYE
jgi:hypothetical protein